MNLDQQTLICIRRRDFESKYTIPSCIMIYLNKNIMIKSVIVELKRIFITSRYIDLIEK